MLIFCGMEVDEELAQVIRDLCDEYNVREPNDKAALIEDVQAILYDD